MSKQQLGLALILVFAGVVGMLLFSQGDTSTQVVQAQAATTNMQSLFERLKTRMDGDPAFVITVNFIYPPIPGEPAWQIPAVLTEEGSSRRISEIGTDYLCFLELGQTFNDSVCVPYSNILMVIYRN